MTDLALQPATLLLASSSNASGLAALAATTVSQWHFLAANSMRMRNHSHDRPSNNASSHAEPSDANTSKPLSAAADSITGALAGEYLGDTCLSPHLYSAMFTSVADAARGDDHATVSSLGSTLTKDITAVFLSLVLIIGVCLLIFGESLVMASTFLVNLLGHFSFQLMFWVAVLSFAGPGQMQGMVKCNLPLLMALGCTVTTQVALHAFIRTYVKVSLFVWGGAGGLFALLLTRDLVGAKTGYADAHDTLWLFGVALAYVVGGILAAIVDHIAMMHIVCLTGAYAVATGSFGLAAEFASARLRPGVFFGLFGAAALVGYVMCCVVNDRDRTGEQRLKYVVRCALRGGSV